MHDKIKPAVTTYAVPVRAAHPLSVWISSVLGKLHGRAIAGDNGAVRIGQPGMSSGRSYSYMAPEQLFIGYNARRVAAGAIRNNAGGLPGTQAPAGEPPDEMTAAIARLSGMTGGR